MTIFAIEIDGKIGENLFTNQTLAYNQYEHYMEMHQLGLMSYFEINLIEFEVVRRYD